MRHTNDHRHRLRSIGPHGDKDAATLLKDFWPEVDHVLKEKGTRMKILKICIADCSRMKVRTMAIARGEHSIDKDEPKIRFISIESFAMVLSARNRELLAMIAQEKPGSLTELAELAGRSQSNLSRTLKTISHYGLAELTKGERGRLVPWVPYDQVSLDVTSTSSTGTSA